MKRSFISILAAAGILLSGCSMEEVPSKEGVIRAVMENDETRTSVTDEGKFTWSADDQIWLGTTSGSVIGTLSTGAGTANATFSYGSFFGEMTGKAVYPYNSGHSVKGEVLDMVLPASYDLGTSLQNTNAALYGVNVDGTLKFNHLAGVMRFKFKNVPAGVNQFVITLDKKINGTFKADLTADYPVLETSATEVEAEKTVTFNFDALAQTSDIMLYVPLPIGTYNSLGLALNKSDESVWTYSNTVTNTVTRKKLILMPTVTLSGSIGGDLEGEDTPAEAVNLSENGTANSYIVSAAGSYEFTPTKGNSNESVGTISSVEVLWESFGPGNVQKGDIIKSVSYDGKIAFQTADTSKEGNAVIATKDASGNILWSWHIWLTDEPQGQVYYNNAGTMMDRDLGAPDPVSNGLLYQWGRKDPFLGGIYCITGDESTITWPSAVASDASNGTIEYATANPTTFITSNNHNNDWYYTGDSSTDNTRWAESVKAKSIYDPCPAGWRVPDGGADGVWSKALGSPSEFKHEIYLYYFNFAGKLGSDANIIYPVSHFIDANQGKRVDFGASSYWSASPSSNDTYTLTISYMGYIYPSSYKNRAYGYSIRCLKEID